jgi:hypothetical protein
MLKTSLMSLNHWVMHPVARVSTNKCRMRFRGRLDTSHHGPQHQFRDIRGTYRQSDWHPQCNGEVPLRCQRELQTVQEVSGSKSRGLRTGKVEAMQWAPLYLTVGYTCQNMPKHHHACTTFVP